MQNFVCKSNETSLNANLVYILCYLIVFYFILFGGCPFCASELFGRGGIYSDCQACLGLELDFGFSMECYCFSPLKVADKM